MAPRKFLRAALTALALMCVLHPVGAQDAAATTQPEAKPPAETQSYGNVGFASLTGPIDRLRHRYLDRVIERARALKLDTVIMHIDTDGGEVGHAREMFKSVIDQARDGPRMIAFVDFRAISAGAMVSYAHEDIYISSGASIGDIGVIFISRDGEIKYAPEKIETVVRSLLAQAAELRGWNRGLLLKMTARTQKLYNVTLPDGTKQYVIEDDLPELLSRHPTIDPENTSKVWVYRGEDRLLTLTGKEAVELGMATGHAEDIDDLYARLGIESDGVVNLTPTFAETTAWSVAPFAPMLAGLAFLFILFELKTPGVGIWALGAVACGAGFLFAQYYLDMAENFEAILIIAGVVLLGIDVVLGIGAGSLAMTGAAMALAGLTMSFIPNELDVDFSDPQFLEALKAAALSSGFSIGVLIAGMFGFIKFAPRFALGAKMALSAESSGTVGAISSGNVANLIGAHGSARDALRPGGMIEIDGRGYTARAAHGVYVEAGIQVTVTGTEFGELLVRPTDSLADAPLGPTNQGTH
jgi:membrane-bound serine protease (ClpP class)